MKRWGPKDYRSGLALGVKLLKGEWELIRGSYGSSMDRWMSWAVCNIFGVMAEISDDDFRLKRGSGLGGPLHHFCGAGGIREGSPDPINYLTHSIRGWEENHLIGRVKGRHQDIFTRFGVPREIATDQGKKFTSRVVQKIVKEHKIKHQNSTPYHPQENGQVESTKKVIEAILTKTVHLHRRDWVENLPEALSAYHTTWRNTMGHTPYEIVYGKQVLFPIEFRTQNHKITVKLRLDLSEAQKQRMAQPNELDEIRQDAIQKTSLVQQQRSKLHDKYIKERKF
eukprot:PITA_25705